jgi:hypothetical protein
MASGFTSSRTGQKYSVLYKTGAGCAFHLDFTSPRLFNFYFFNQHFFVPRFDSITSSYFIGFLYVNNKLRYIRNFLDDLPKYSRSSGSDSTIIAKDAYQSRLIITLPSGQKKFFFILAQALRVLKRSEPSSFFGIFSARKKRQNAGYLRNIG